ncbi:hypothetical protein BDV93DRAFT_473010 [Ceratobasidium sp. AG-I]|nr:hypothetical protein BDV93DRAFT_473010 [Ceratobasidium sp. AG-I]
MSHTQISVLGLSISTAVSPKSSMSGKSARSSKSRTSSAYSDSSASSASEASDSDGPAAYHTNLASLLPTLNLPPPLTGMSRLRAVAVRQWVGHLDILGVLAKVVMRPHPVINLGPIDHTASCVIVDLDLPDRPLIWASESFCQMSGYALEDIRGRNLRFMQAPGGEALVSDASRALKESNERMSPAVGSKPKSPRHASSPRSPQSRPGPSTIGGPSSTDSSSSTETVDATPTPVPTPKPTHAYIPPPDSHVPAGSARKHTDQATVDTIRAKLDANEEIQATLLNYRCDGTPFWNYLSIVPVREGGEGSRFRYHVGIMVDLVQQPRAIMQTMQAGFYVRSTP